MIRQTLRLVRCVGVSPRAKPNQPSFCPRLEGAVSPKVLNSKLHRENPYSAHPPSCSSFKIVPRSTSPPLLMRQSPIHPCLLRRRFYFIRPSYRLVFFIFHSPLGLGVRIPLRLPIFVFLASYIYFLPPSFVVVGLLRPSHHLVDCTSLACCSSSPSPLRGV